MSATAKGSKRIPLYRALLPLFVFYIGLYALFFVPEFKAHSPGILIIRLIIGVVLLGGLSYVVRPRGSVPKVWLAAREIDSPLALYSILIGAFLFFFFLFISSSIYHTNDATRFLALYGPYNAQNFLLPVLLVSLALYTFSEELYFRGILYPYLKSYGTIFGVVISSALFAIAHLAPAAPFFSLLFILSLINIALLEFTGTLFYGALVHASLDIVGILSVTQGLQPYFLYDAHFFYAALAFIVLIGIGFFLRNRAAISRKDFRIY